MSNRSTAVMARRLSTDAGAPLLDHAQTGGGHGV